jgi:hypothetical protein
MDSIMSIKWRCSALGAIMTNITSDKLTKGHETAGKQALREHIHGISKVYGNKYTKKGIFQEEAAITLLSRYLKQILKKNDKRLSNFFITGHPDTFLGEIIEKAVEGFDTKCSWDANTFPQPDDELASGYEFQNHGYMYLTGAAKWTTAHCLVNALPDAILQEKRSLYYNLGQPDEHDDEYVYQCMQIEKNMIFNMEQFKRDNPHFDLHIKDADWKYDWALNERVIQHEVKRDENIIGTIAKRVQMERIFMKDYYVKYYKKTA